MTSQEAVKHIKKLPDAPGVYFFKAPDREILYIGRATSLKSRVRSYFGKDLINSRGPLLVEMVERASKVEFRETDSVLEALILEAAQIKTHQPKYNTKEKDDKSFNYVVLTDEEYPAIEVVRGRTVMNAYPAKRIKYLFGPFPHGGMLRDALKIVRKIFPYRDVSCVPAEVAIASGGKPRACFARQIGLCPGVCTGEIAKKDYAATIRQIKMFFEGRKKALVRSLKKEMKGFAQRQEFEKADEMKRRIFALSHIEDVSLVRDEIKLEAGRGLSSGAAFRIEAYDVAHIAGSSTAGVMVVVEDGEIVKSEIKRFRVRGNFKGSDTGALREIILRRLNHPEWRLPNLMVADGGLAQRRTIEDALKSKGIHTIPVLAVTKDERHRPKSVIGDDDIIELRRKDVLLANNEAHAQSLKYHKKLRENRPS